MNKAVISPVRALLLACAAHISSPVQAQDVAPEGWSGEAELGFVVTGGNTDTETINAKFKLVDEHAPWSHTGKLDVLNSSNNGEDIADRVFASVKTDLSFGKFNYLFGLLSYENDKFSGYEYRASESVGYGRRVLQTDTLILNAEAGLGARQSELSDTGESRADGIVRIAGQFEWIISESARFTEELDSEAGGDLTVTRSLSAVSAQIVGNLAAKFTVRVTHSSEAPPGLDKTDTEISTTLVYEF